MNKISRILLVRKMFGLSAPASESWRKYKDYVNIHPTAIIHASANLEISRLPSKPKVMISIGANSHIYANFALLTEDSEIVIGSDCQIGSSILIAAEKITIGDGVIVSWGCTFLDSNNHALRWEDRCQDVANGRESYLSTNGKSISALHDWSKVSTQPIVVEPRAYIGMNVSILKGVRIGEEAVIGAGSVVRQNMPSRSVSMGNPAIIVRYVN